MPPAHPAHPSSMEQFLPPMEPVRWPTSFDDPNWQFEIKWDGVRCVASCRDGTVRFHGRRGTDWTGRFPEIEQDLRAERGVFDGELVVLEGGRPSFPAMLRRLQRRSGALHYMVFDRLQDADGRDLRPLALPLRQAALPPLSGSVRRVSPIRGEGQALFRTAEKAGLEGIVAKRLDSPYVSGKSPLWRKIKCWRSLTCLVLGADVSRGEVRSLRLGLPEGEGVREIGSVGGLGAAQGREVLAALRESAKPLPCHVAYMEWTPEGQLRHPRWQGLLRERS